MGRLGRLAAAFMPLALAGCLWTPGKFSSTLALNSTGSFVLDYRGEIMLQLPNDSPRVEAWTDELATCHADGRLQAAAGPIAVSLGPDDPVEADENNETRPCSPSEISRLRAEYERQAAEKRDSQKKESEEMARLLGLPGSDDESNRRFAAKMMRHKGWRSVSYRGSGIFEVDYHLEGKLEQDFAFPLMPDSDLMIPFITIRPRTDGSVKISAPAFVGGAGVFAARARALGVKSKGDDGPASHASGRFTVVTDGEILTNNSEEGPVAVKGRQSVHWDVGPGSQRVPEMMVKL